MVTLIIPLGHVMNIITVECFLSIAVNLHLTAIRTGNHYTGVHQIGTLFWVKLEYLVGVFEDLLKNIRF